MDFATAARIGLSPARRTVEQPEEEKQAAATKPLARGPANAQIEPNKGVLESLTDVGLSGLAVAGNILDVPGSMVRDVATWVPGGVKAQNPFDQLLTPWSSKNRVMGDELVQSATGGAIDKDSWTGFGTGLAAEILMDPLTYLTFGGSAVGKAGRVAQASGLARSTNLRRVANKLASRELGKDAGRKLGTTQARQSLTPRNLIDEAASDVELEEIYQAATRESEAKLADLFDPRSEIRQTINQRAASEGWDAAKTKSFIDETAESIRREPELAAEAFRKQASAKAMEEFISKGGTEQMLDQRLDIDETAESIRREPELAAEALRKQKSAKAMEEFISKGGTEQMLDQRLGGVARFSIPFISKKFGDKYPLLRERLLGTTQLTPAELASKKWYQWPARAAGTATDAAKAPGGPDGPDIPPSDPGATPGDPTPPSDLGGPGTPPASVAPPVAPAIRGSQGPLDFRGAFSSDRAGDILIDQYWNKIQQNPGKPFVGLNNLTDPKKMPIFEQLIYHANKEGLIDSIDDLREFAQIQNKKEATEFFPEFRRRKLDGANDPTRVPSPADVSIGDSSQSSPSAPPAPEVDRPSKARQEFASISPRHKLFDEELNNLTKGNAIDESTAEVVREMMRDSSLDLFEKIRLRAVNNIAMLGGGKDVKPAGVFNRKSGIIRISKEVVKDRQGRQLEVLTHELFHGLMERSYAKQADAGVDIIREFDKLIESGEVEKYFNANYSKGRARHYASNPHEAAAQLFTDSILNRRIPQGPLQEFIAKLKTAAVKYLREILGRGTLSSEASKKVDAMADLIGGFITADEYKKLIGGEPDVAEVIDAARKGAKGDPVEAVTSAKKIRKKGKGKAKVPLSQVLSDSQDPNGVIDEIASITFETEDAAEAAADLATARIRELQGSAGKRGPYYAGVPTKNEQGGYVIEFIDVRKEADELAQDKTRGTKRSKARVASGDAEYDRIAQQAFGRVLETEQEAVRFAEELNRQVPADIRSRGAGFAARETEDGTFIIEEIDLPDPGRSVNPLEDAARVGTTNERLDSLEQAADRRFGAARPVQEGDELTQDQAMDSVIGRTNLDPVLEDDQWLGRMAQAGPSVPTKSEGKVQYSRLAAGSYVSKDGRIEINKLPDGSWAWAIDEVGYDAANTLSKAKIDAQRALENDLPAARTPSAQPTTANAAISEMDQRLGFNVKRAAREMFGEDVSDELLLELDERIENGISSGLNARQSIANAIDAMIDPRNQYMIDAFGRYEDVKPGSLLYPEKQRWESIVNEARRLSAKAREATVAPDTPVKNAAKPTTGAHSSEMAKLAKQFDKKKFDIDETAQPKFKSVDNKAATLIEVSGKTIGAVESMKTVSGIERRSLQSLGIKHEGEVRRLQGIEIFNKDNRGKGFGKNLYLQHFAEHPLAWFYNSQAMESAGKALESLERDGLIKLVWDKTDESRRAKGYTKNYGPHAMRITKKGFAEAKRQRAASARFDVDDGLDLLGDADIPEVGPSEAAARKSRSGFGPLQPTGKYAGRAALQTDDQNLKKFYGKSVLVDEAGQPIPMYHGTRSDFTEFQVPEDGLINQRLGIHLAKDPSVTEAFTVGTYAKDRSAWSATPENQLVESGRDLLKPGGQTKQVFARLEKPYEIPDYGGTDQTDIAIEAFGITMPSNPEALKAYLKHMRNVTDDEAEFIAAKMRNNQPFSVGTTTIEDYHIEEFGDAYRALAHQYGGLEFGPKINGVEWGEFLANGMRQALKKDGYDGIEYINKSPNEVTGGADPTSYIVFDSTQIKSATGNRGTFDSSNPDIRFDIEEPEPVPQRLGGETAEEQASRGIYDKAKKGAAGATERAKGFYAQARKSGNVLLDNAMELRRDGSTGAMVGAAVDAAGGAIMAIPGVRTLTGMFVPEVMGAIDPQAQEAGRQHYEAIERTRYAVRKDLAPVLRKLTEHPELNLNAVETRLGPGKFDEAYETVMQNYFDVRSYLEEAVTLLDKGSPPASLPDRLADLRPTLDTMRANLQEAARIARANGIAIGELNDMFVRYFPRQRQRIPSLREAFGNYGKFLEPGVAHQLSRLPFLKDIPGGTTLINELSINSDFSGIASKYPNREIPKDVADQLAKSLADEAGKVVDSLPDETIADLAQRMREEVGGGDIRQRVKDRLFMLEDNTNQLDNFVKWLANLDPKHAAEKIPVFKLDPASDLLRYVESSMIASGAANFATSLVANGARAAEPGGMSIAEVVVNLTKEGMDGDELDRIVSRKMGDAYKEKYALMQQNRMLQIKKEIARLSQGIDTATESWLFGQNAMTGIPARTKSGIVGEIVGGNPDGTYKFFYPSKGTEIQEIDGKPRTVEKNIRAELNLSLDDIEGNISPRDVFKQFSIDPTVGSTITRYMRGHTHPESMNITLNAIRQLTNLYKTGLTVMWPAFHVRNLISGQYNNWLINASDPRYAGNVTGRAYWQPVMDADKLVRGEVVEGVLEIPAIKQAGITSAEQAMDWIRNEAFANRLYGPTQGQSNEVIGQMDGAFSKQIPGTSKTRFRDLFFKPPPMQRGASPYDVGNPLSAAGFGGNESDGFLPYRVGRQVGEYVEGLNRLAPYIAFLRQGVDSKEAARRVFEAQFDYTKATPTERLMKIAFPFYSFTRNNIPFVLRNLAENPGGKMAQTVRGVRAAQTDEPLPDYLASTTAIPYPLEERGMGGDETKTFITGLGLGFEDALAFGTLGAGNYGDATRQVLSRMNPVPKFLLESAFGESTYFDGPGGGRALSDLDPSMGRIRDNIKQLLTGEETRGTAKPLFGSETLEQLALSSPASRAINTVRTLTDPRKLTRPDKMLLNLVTGLKVSDVSPASWDAAVQAKAMERLREMGARDFVRAYIPEYMKDRMTEEELTETEEIQAILTWLASRSKDRKALQQDRQILQDSLKEEVNAEAQ